ncbi:hypothetical protein FRB94_011308 [Tulasnella sp. JGI-2019a]|nr:hypothetical protein FRB93_010131 [Tulasnella sp. JGI-2019a]KAG8992771.1 hypothetical protein FRB94_011308 [Tulasnella sp. JGI-2019a]
MDIDIDPPVSNIVESSSAVTELESLLIGPRGHQGTRLALLTLSSSDSGSIVAQKQVAWGDYSNMYQGPYTPTNLKLAMKHPRTLGKGTIQAVDARWRYEREVKTWLSLSHVDVLPFYGVVKYLPPRIS